MLAVSGFSLLFIAILVYQTGLLVTRLIPFLHEYNIPAPVTGGLIASLVFTLSEHALDIKIDWDLELRNQLLLIFFCSVGLCARIRLLIGGGKTLSILFFVIALFLVLQNSVGTAFALLIGDEPIHGLLAGTISMAGGHGTAISWGEFLEGQGYQGATEFGLMAATMGLIMGGLLGGPVARQLIRKHRLSPHTRDVSPNSNPATPGTRNITVCMQHVLRVVLIISACVVAGCLLNAQFRQLGIVMPDYLPVLVLGIMTINLADLAQVSINEQFITLFGDFCLELFITMSLMSIDLMNLAATALPAFLIVMAQSLTICLFAYSIFFRAAGNDYDASLVTAGFIGLGLGATPVGLANVSTLAHRLGPSPKALLIVPLLGSVFTDTLNAFVLQCFLALPFFH